MATIRFFNLSSPTQTGSGRIEATATRLSVTLGDATDNYTGVFVYSGSTLVGGTVTGYTHVQQGVLIVSVEGLVIPATTLAQTVMAGDVYAANQLLFAGNDEIFGSANGELLNGGAGNDTIIALDGDDRVRGGVGNDDVNGNVGFDLVYGETGDDIVRGGKGNDTVYGGDGDDFHVNGNIGDDVVYGDLGSDTLYGGQNNDTLNGGFGDDLLSGDLGDDYLYGDAGADIFAIRLGGGNDIAVDFNAAQGDRIGIAAGVSYTYGLLNGGLCYTLSDGTRLVVYTVFDTAAAASWVVTV